MAQHESSSATLRLTLLTLVVAGMFAALFSRLWFLQVLAGDRYVELADSNRVRWVITAAPRGRVLDRDGEPLVKNRPALTVSANRNRLVDGDGEPRDHEAELVISRLSALLDMTPDEIVEAITNRKYSPFRPTPIKKDVAPEVIFQIKERQEHFAGVDAETLPVRVYPQATTAAHVVGYLGEISEEQLAAERFSGYRLGDLVGKSGVEAAYEEHLRGVEGLQQLEVNARGVTLGTLAQRAPIPGNELVTTLDLELQREVERVLEEGIVASRAQMHRQSGQHLKSVAGSAVVLDPRNGEVIAMASWPTYDPGLFVGGIDAQAFDRLHDKDNGLPILNRAIQGEYPPGSTWKIVSAEAALQAGQITPQSTLPCPPRWGWGKRNWYPRHDGTMDVARALMRSCDTFFYELSYDQWRAEEQQKKAGQPVDERYQATARQFGFGDRVGIDLPGERPGRVPGREWKQSYWEEMRDTYCRKAQELPPGEYAHRLYSELCKEGNIWRGGDAVNMSIGQGDVLTTPLQLATAFGAVANGGKVWRPHLGLEVRSPDGKETLWRYEPETVSEVAFAPGHLQAIRRGLEMVVREPRGTANYAFRSGGNPFPLDQIPVAGKTGTAEVGGKLPSAWFVAYAPANAPRYVVVVAVEEGGGGSQTAAPIARRILEAAFDLPVTPFRAGVATD
ncbi:MAG: penicillin-binding protein 2 [Actinomycetota bacterium]|nr:penicillin-binding protein 2 [Actinomycetota bacterium]